MFDTPYELIIDHKTSLFEKYSVAIDFQSPRQSGWRYSGINSLEPAYEDATTSMIRFSFSRLDGSDQVISSTDATH